MKIEQIALEKLEKHLNDTYDNLQPIWDNSSQYLEQVLKGTDEKAKNLQLMMHRQTTKISKDLGGVRDALNALKDYYQKVQE